MEAVPKVHRHRHRRSNSRRHHERSTNNSSTSNNSDMAAVETVTTTTTSTNILAAEEGLAGSSSPAATAAAALVMTASSTRLTQENERQSSSEALDGTTECSVSQQTVVLVNGHSVAEQDVANEVEPLQLEVSYDQTTIEMEVAGSTVTKETLEAETTKRSESPQPTANGSSRNSSGDAMSLRETLQQLQPTTIAATLSSSHHQRRRTSPSPGRRSRADEPDPATSYFHRGIIGFMDREIKSNNSSAFATPSPTPSVVAGGASKKLQSLSDPQASPALRSTRSRSSLEKSPRRKRSKSESRRRRERKLIAAGEMEVRQANETLMRYLKQCTDINDASLSGELEIDQNLDERRVHRKTKSQRDKRGHLISKLYTAGGLTSILKELSDDIVPADGEEIYNPFTPVVSPTDDAPAHIDKMFIQTSSGYRPVDHCYYKHSFVGASHHGGVGVGAGGGCGSGAGVAGSSTGAGGGGIAGHRNGSRGSLVGMRGSGSYSDTRCLLDAQCRSSEITSNLHLACVVQRIWILLSNICHGLLAGLALAHLLFVITSHPMDWSKIINDISLAGEATMTQQQQQQQTLQSQYTTTSEASEGYDVASGLGVDLPLHGAQSLVVIADYASFAAIYANTFYCLAIICLVSVFDRMDICHLDLSNATELVSFRWIIIAMIYIATIILSICSNSIDDKLYFDKAANVTLTQQELLSNQVLNIWNSLSVARSLGAIFGWIMIGLTPHDDLLYEHLLDMARYETNN